MSTTMHYEVFGGIPHYVLGRLSSDDKVAASRQKDLDGCCNTFTIDMFREDYSHLLFNVVVERNDDDSYDYYSHLIDFAEHICEALGKKEKDVYVCVSVI